MSIFHKKCSVTDIFTIPIFHPKYAIVPCTEEKKTVNLSQGTAAFCINKLVKHSDMMDVRERINDIYGINLSYKDKLKKIKGFTAGQV